MTAPAHEVVGPVRLACSCGDALTIAGKPEVVAKLVANWDRSHDPAKPGHGPTRRPPSQDGRAPRRPAATRRNR